MTQAESGVSARAQMEGLSFDCLILDVMMPGESGFEIAERLRQASDVPILMLRPEPSRNIGCVAWNLALTITFEAF